MKDRTAARHAHNYAQQRAFDDVAAIFEQPPPEDVLQRLETVVNRAEIQPHEAILDIGTGTGVLIPFILEHHPSRVLACDLSGEMLQRASRRFGNNVATFQTDVVDISLEHGPFGVVFCNAAFGNVHDQRETLEAISSLLDFMGRLVISHPMGSGFVRRLKEESPQYHLKELPNEKQLQKLLEGTGLVLSQFTDESNLYLAISIKTAKYRNGIASDVPFV